MSSVAFESLISESYPNIAMPPLWQVIYQEGIRRNHILFSPKDVARFEAMTAWEIKDLLNENSHIEDIVLNLMEATDLSGMIDVIDRQSFEVRHQLYTLYKYGLTLASHQLRASLN